MLKPYICVACEKVILEQPLPGGPPQAYESAAGVASLITLFNKIVAVVSYGPQGLPSIPPTAVIPKDWAIFSSWDVEPGDENRNYVICTQIHYPDESPFGAAAKNPLKIEPKKRSQNVVRIGGFPIGQEGTYTVRTWLEENGQRVFGPIEFKIELEIVKQEQPQPVQ
jgi:hypothetical protein